MSAAWVIRAGRSGENELWNVEHDCASVGSQGVGGFPSACDRVAPARPA